MAQSVQAHEVIVVDNGRERIDRATLPEGVRLLVAPVRAGASQARNIGAASAESAYVAFLDDDDEWHEDYLAQVDAAVQREPTVGLFACALHGRETRAPIVGKNESGPFSAMGMARRNPGVVGSNLVFERERFLRHGGFDPRLVASEDVDIVIRFVEAGESVVRVAEAITYYDSSHEQARLSHISTLLAGKRALARKHLAHWPARTALLADYAARLLIARFRSARA